MTADAFAARAGSGAAAYLTFGPGTSLPAWLALGLAIGLLALGLRPSVGRRIANAEPRVVLGLLAGLAALLSTAYLAYYLRGGPRIVDATSYFLEGRALARGYFAFPVPEPEASFHGRFLLAPPEGGALGVLFPPGYPAALALLFLVGTPLALGPLLAAALVPATHWLAREMGATRATAYAAAALSVLSVALRYHTAETMSHGLAALLFALGLAGSARGTRGSLLLAGLCLGWLVATRPLSGAVALVAAALLARGHALRALWLLPALVPGLTLLALHQHALTGEWLGSTQRAYYALADGPPDCFRFGLGAGIGCLYEHGDFVRARLGAEFGLGEALATTGRRLLVHLADIANLAPLALAVPYGAWVARAEPVARVAFFAIAGLVALYAGFYFEGSYPGGGARFFADVLPLEHALAAFALSRLELTRWAWPLSVAGFALHTHHQHDALREREGGRPMFEPRVLSERGIERGLVFVGTDHGFALGHVPGTLSAESGLVVARRRNDALDGLLWERLGRPPSYRYDFSPSRPGAQPELIAYTPALTPVLRIEGESLWPPRWLEGGWAHPDFPPVPCASQKRGLRLRPTAASMRVRIELPPLPFEAEVVVGWIGPPAGSFSVREPRDAARQRPFHWEDGTSACLRSAAIGPFAPGGRPVLDLEAGSAYLDYIDLREVTPKRR